MKTLPPFSQFCKQRRNQLKMTAVQLAELCNVKPSYISKVESGEIRQPRTEKAKLFAVALQTTYERVASLIESAYIGDLSYERWMRLWRHLVRLDDNDMEIAIKLVSTYVNMRLLQTKGEQSDFDGK
jgi:transcriptional regulator with XRE-family HTH domain